MGKQVWKPATMLNPVPVVMVTCADNMGKGNIITLAWAGTVNSDPPMLSVSVRKERYSYGLIKEKGQFAVNLPTRKLARATDLCGVKSGRDVDKFKLAGLTPEKASVIDVPIIKECPVSIECVVKNVFELGTHDMFLAEIVAVDVDEELLDKKGKLKLHSAAGESDGSFEFDLKKGRGAITLDGQEYSFTAGWDIITVEGMGGFERADEALDVAVFVMQHGKSPLEGTWYDVSGQYGTVTFEAGGTCWAELYGKTTTGTYTFDVVTGEGFIMPDNGSETMHFVLTDGILALEGVTYTQQYVEQPDEEDYYAVIAGSWVAVRDNELALEFAVDGTVVFYSGSGSARGVYTFNPLDWTGTIVLEETEYYSFWMTEDTLYVGDYPYMRADAVNIPVRDSDSLLGIWYDEAGQAGMLYFDENGVVTMDTYGVVYEGTYTFDSSMGSGTMVLEVDGEDVTVSIYLLYGKLYTDDTVYTQTYVEQAQ